MNKEQITFCILMAREIPADAPLVLTDVLHDLMRLARHHKKLQEMACNEPVPEGHDEKCEGRIRELCEEINCVPVFSGDPRGCTVKLKVPSGRTNDWGREGICVPQ